jgi:hypothetical protein
MWKLAPLSFAMIGTPPKKWERVMRVNINKHTNKIRSRLASRTVVIAIIMIEAC